MAQHITSVCDWCDLHGITDIPASRSRILALDGPPRRVDVCRRCDIALGDLDALYERGQELPAGTAPPRARRAARAVPAGATAELPGSGSIQAAPAVEKPKAWVVCPLPHPSTGGRSLRVAYANRGNHADMVHSHAKIWDIVWEDPDGITTHPCTTHTPCREHNLRFTTAKGLTAHINACPLPHTDPDRGSVADSGSASVPEQSA